MAGLKGLDDYIMGIHQRGEEDVRHICPKCKMVRFVPMFFDMGGWFYHDDDEGAWCKNCQVEMVIEEIRR